MKNIIKVKTQKNISTILALALAMVTLFQAITVNSVESYDETMAFEEAELLAEIEEMLMEENEQSLEDEIYFDFPEAEDVKVYNSRNELIGEGNTARHDELRKLVNRADFLSEASGRKYYRVAE